MNNKYILNRIIEQIIIDEYGGNNAIFAQKVKLSRQFVGQIRNDILILGISPFLEMLDDINKKAYISVE